MTCFFHIWWQRTCCWWRDWLWITKNKWMLFIWSKLLASATPKQRSHFTPVGRTSEYIHYSRAGLWWRKALIHSLLFPDSGYCSWFGHCEHPAHDQPVSSDPVWCPGRALWESSSSGHQSARSAHGTGDQDHAVWAGGSCPAGSRKHGTGLHHSPYLLTELENQ